MSETKHTLLVVDDDEEELHSCELAIRDEARKKGAPITFRVITAKTAEEATEIARNQFIDCAIVDLRLPAEKNDEDRAESGNTLLMKLLRDHAIPCVLHSAHPAELDLGDAGNSIKVIDKGGGEYPKIFGWFYQQASLMNAMASIRQRMMQETALLFHRSVLPHWEDTQEFLKGDSEVEKVILRQIAAHMAEHFSLPMPETPKHHVHEVYFRPPLRAERIHTGDLVRHNDAVFIVVTPQCNIANDYPDHLLLARCDSMQPKLDEIRTLLGSGKTKQDKARKRIRDLANQQVGISEHFLPPCGDEGPWKVDFKTILSVSKDAVEELKASRIASMSPQFMPNLIQRFSAYMGRHGQPDLDPAELEHYLFQHPTGQASAS